MLTHRIWMFELDDLEEGWCCGRGRRSNHQFHRTEVSEDADIYDVTDAVRIAAEYQRYGYPCEVRPKVPAAKQLEILRYDVEAANGGDGVHTLVVPCRSIR